MKKDNLTIEEKYNYLCNKPSDINEHLSTLKKYGDKCNSITEMGVRWIVSTYAFLYSSAKKITSYDIQLPEFYKGNINEVYKLAAANNKIYNFIQGDTLSVSIEDTDLLFIDTFHSYGQLSTELKLHNFKVNKYIILHDTVEFGRKDETLYNEVSNNIKNYKSEFKGLLPALEQFLHKNKNWNIHEQFYNNNGLTVLKRII